MKPISRLLDAAPPFTHRTIYLINDFLKSYVGNGLKKIPTPLCAISEVIDKSI